MKKFLPLLCLMALLQGTVHAQKYKTAADTIKLNTAYAKLEKSIAALNVKLLNAQNDLPAYQAKAKDAQADAASAANASSEQADKANNGKVKDAKKAKRRANKAYGEAKDSRSADNKLKNLESDISKYQKELSKDQQKLAELEAIRAAIRMQGN